MCAFPSRSGHYRIAFSDGLLDLPPQIGKRLQHRGREILELVASWPLAGRGILFDKILRDEVGQPESLPLAHVMPALPVNEMPVRSSADRETGMILASMAS